MKILHINACGPFTDGLSYQENLLIEQHVALGHDVSVIAGVDTYSADKRLVRVRAGDSRLQCGAHLIRLPYLADLHPWLASKIRAYRGMAATVAAIAPDRILFHGLCAWDLPTVAGYVRRHPGTKLFADCHEDFNNSAMTWASRELLHKRFYRPLFQRSLADIAEVLCVTVESLDFAIDFYGSPRGKTHLYPLGCIIEDAATLERRRMDFRRERGFDQTQTVITQTGKLDRMKQLPAALKAFHGCADPSLRFVLAGRMTDDVQQQCQPLIDADDRILDLGWQTTDQLSTVLAGSDVFLQPFGQTVTTQMAMGCGCAVLAQDLPSHRWLVGEHGKLFRDASELDDVFRWVAGNAATIQAMRAESRRFAMENLDYRKLAQHIAE